MRKVQITLVALLMFVGIMISGEFYVDYLYSFEDMWSVDFKENGYGAKNMLDDLYGLAEENCIKICAISTEVNSTYDSEKQIYCDNEFKQYLEKEYYVTEGKHRGLLSGTVTVKYNDFNTVPEEKINASVGKLKFYVEGNRGDIDNFIQKVPAKYEGKLSENRMASGVLQAEKSLIVIWGIIGFMIMILSYYVLQIEKKESIIRITLGESTRFIFLQKALMEIVIVCGFFELIKILMSNFQYTDLAIDIVRRIVYATALVCALIQITVLFFDVSIVMSNAKISKEVVCMNYILKFLTTAITIILIVSEISEIGSYLEYYKQKEFFEFFEGYNYVQIKTEDVVNADPSEYAEKMYRDNVDKKDIVYFVDDVQGVDNVNIISANKNAKAYIENVIPELKGYKFEEGVYVIYNENTKLSDKIMLEVKDMGSMQYSGDKKPDYKFVTYKNDVSFPFICLGEEYNSKAAQNPMIAFVNMTQTGEYNIGDGNIYQIFFEYAMWNASDEEISQALKKIDSEKLVSANTVDVYQTYMDKLMILKRVAFIKIALIAALLIIVLVISRMLIQITYAADATEIAIKKTLGYRIFERYKKLYISSMCINVVAIICGYLYVHSKYYESMEVSDITICLIGVAVMIADLLIISAFILKNEKVSVQKTLKGGCL